MGKEVGVLLIQGPILRGILLLIINVMLWYLPGAWKCSPVDFSNAILKLFVKLGFSSAPLSKHVDLINAPFKSVQICIND